MAMQESERSAVRALSFLLVTLALYLFLWQVFSQRFDFPAYYYTRLIEFLALCLFVSLLFFTPMRFSKMGIVVPRAVLFRSLSLGGGVALLFVAGFALVDAFRGGFSFAWHLAGDASRVTYFLVAPFQEILAKSVMLYSFELILDERHPRLANLLAATFFGAFHVVYGARMMLLSAGLSLLTGVIFHRERCVWGPALTHFALGFFPLCFGIG